MNEKLIFLKNRYVSQCDVCDSEKTAEFLHPMKCSDFCEVCSFRGCFSWEIKIVICNWNHNMVKFRVNSFRYFFQVVYRYCLSWRVWHKIVTCVTSLKLHHLQLNRHKLSAHKPLNSTQIHIHSLYIYIFTIFVACTGSGGGGSVAHLSMPL